MSDRARPLAGWRAAIAIGVLTGLTAAIGMTLVRPVLFAFALGGLVVLIPTFWVRDQRAYWLFLLVLSIPFDVGKRMTSWLVDPFAVLRTLGPPVSGTVSLDLYLTDVILFAMVLPWLVQLCFRRTRFYFPKIGYIFILYLVWALIVSLSQGNRLYLAMFEWGRELLYFLSFIYVVNNVVTRSQFRAVLVALLLGLALEAGAVITLYYYGVGLETNILSGIYAKKDVGEDLSQPGGELYAEGPGKEEHHKRSAGLLEAPALAAYHLEFTLPLVLACLVTAARRWQQILFGTIFAAGCVALFLTFSRSGLAGFLCGLVAFFIVVRWSGLISRRAFVPLVFIFAASVALCTPLIVWTVEARLETASFRLELLKTGLDTYLQQPILGSGFAGMNEGGRQSVPGSPGKTMLSGFHNHYLSVLTEVGPLGFLLFFGFFWQIAIIAFRAIRRVDPEVKPMLVGIVTGLASIAVHNLGDGFGGHVTYALLFLYIGLIVAIARRVEAERALAAPAPGSAVAA